MNAARDAALAALRGQIGQPFGPSNWINIDQGMIDSFATVTQDDQFIHVDPARAAETALGGTIAHGFLTLGLCSRFTYDSFPPLPGQAMGINYGFDRLRFLNVVRPGDRLRGVFVLNAVSPRGDDALMRRIEMTVEIDGSDKPALAADWLALVQFDPDWTDPTQAS